MCPLNKEISASVLPHLAAWPPRVLFLKISSLKGCDFQKGINLVLEITNYYLELKLVVVVGN